MENQKQHYGQLRKIGLASLGAFRTFVRFALVWLCLFPLGVWKGLRFVIVAFPGLFSYPFLLSFFLSSNTSNRSKKGLPLETENTQNHEIRKTFRRTQTVYIVQCGLQDESLQVTNSNYRWVL